MALIPLFMRIPSGGAISLLIILMASRGLFGAVTTCSFNSWIRDLIPQESLGRTFSKLLMLSTAAAVVFSLGAALFVDFWQGQGTGQSNILGYTYVLLFGALFLGLASPVFMAMMPEPLMQPVLGKQPSILRSLAAPFRDRNFSRVLQFLFFWGLASNMVIPFFAVYMLKRLGLPLSWVIGLSILSQLFSILFFRVWGRLVDRFGSKVVLSLCVSLYLLVIFGWMFTTMPERYLLTIPLLIILHILAGVAAGGIAITISTIGLKLSPRGEATPYLAGASLARCLGAGLRPLFGGLLADFFSTRQLAFTFTWTSSLNSAQAPALSIIGLDFLFGIAFIFGLITLGILARIREEGEVSREVVLESLMFPNRKISSPMSLSPSNGLLSDFPFSLIKRIPVPGLDVVIGVTAYQIAEAARVATLTAARGAMHVVDEKPLAVENLVGPVATSVVKASSKAGVNPLNGVHGASQGIVQGAVETSTDVTASVKETIEAAKEVAKQTGISEDSAVIKATVGALEAAQSAGPEVVESVKKALRTIEQDEKEK